MAQELGAGRAAERGLVRPALVERRDLDVMRDPVQLGLRAAVVPEVGDHITEELADQRLRLRALDLERRHVGLADLHVQTGERLHAERVQQRVGVREREPEAILPQPEEDRIVDDPAVGGAEHDVLALPDLARRQVARGQELRESGGVRTRDLDLSLHGDVPESHVLQQVPVLRDVVVVQRRDQHVVVQIPAGAPGLDGSGEVRRLLVPAREVEREAVVQPWFPIGHGRRHPARRRGALLSFTISRTQL